MGTAALLSIAAFAVMPSPALAANQPSHVVVVVMQDRFSDALTTYTDLFPYVNSLAANSLVYTNSHGVHTSSLANSLALYSGSTHGASSDGSANSFPVLTAPNLGQSLFDAGYTFSGYVEALPGNGSQAKMAAGFVTLPNGQVVEPLDLYGRKYNPMALFTDPVVNQGGQQTTVTVNNTFDAFADMVSARDFSLLPTVSYVIPHMLHSTHGTSEEHPNPSLQAPWAGASDGDENNVILRQMADEWLRDVIEPYRQWAADNNSLLIITQDAEWYTGGTADTITTLVTGDLDLFNPGVDDTWMNHYNLLATLSQWYNLGPIGDHGASPLHFGGDGKLSAVPEPGTALAMAATACLILARRRRRSA